MQQEIQYALPNALTIENAESLVEELRALPLLPGATLLLNVKAVDTLTTAGAQILVSLQKTLKSIGAECVFEEQNSLFSQVLNDLGLGTLFDIVKQ